MYKPIKSSVRHLKSMAKKMFEERQKKIRVFASYSKNKTSVSAVKTSQDKARQNKLDSSQRVMRVVPIRQASVVKQLPETSLMRKGLSLKQLLRTTPKLMKNNSMDVVVSKLVRKKTKSGLPAVEAVTYTADPYRPNKSRRDHKAYIIGIDSQDQPITKQRRVMISCSCENYIFTWEYANALHGASKLVYGNGDPATFTNPDNLPGMCKHLVAITKEITDKGW
jgi:hypothetical protein